MFQRALCLAALGFVLLCTKAEAQAPAIKVGATLALTGKLSYLGHAEQRGLEMAITDLNSSSYAGSSDWIDLKVEDNVGDPRTAVTSVQKMLDGENVEIIYSAFTHVTAAIAPVVAKSNAVMVYASSSREIAKMSPKFFRDNFDASEGGTLLGNMIAGRRPASIGVLTETSEVCTIALDALKPILADAGIPIKDIAEFNSGEQDLKPLLLRLRATRADALAICAWRDEATLMPQMAALKMLQIPTYHFFAPFLPTADSPALKDLFEQNGTFSIWYGFAETPTDPAVAAWVDRYKSRFGEIPRPDSLFSYEDMMFIGTGAKICRKNGTEMSSCLASYLQQKTFVGISGPLKFNQDRLINRKIFPIRFKEGNWSPIQTKN